jgi:queuine tRNA-ribosyltransferase accessory subunit
MILYVVIPRWLACTLVSRTVSIHVHRPRGEADQTAYSPRLVLEKKIAHAPILRSPAEERQSRLRIYTAVQDDMLTILAPRRNPVVSSPSHNTSTGISICTSVGFSWLSASDYHRAVQILSPDIAIAMADVVTSDPISVKRAEKCADRTHAWLQDAGQLVHSSQESLDSPAIFAALPPMNNTQQALYLQDLNDTYRDLISGLAVYSADTAANLPRGLASLPRICLSDPSSPHALLDDMMLGIDIFTVSFIASSSDHGIALSFQFSGQILGQDILQPLGTDMWSSVHETSLCPLSIECECSTCVNHHRAYLHHLLKANEMLAWTLLQIHNHAVMDRFFEACRNSISVGTFQEQTRIFGRRYEAQLPVKTGLGPRVRGYQARSVGGGETRKNPKLWGKLGISEGVAEPEIVDVNQEEKS